MHVFTPVLSISAKMFDSMSLQSFLFNFALDPDNRCHFVTGDADSERVAKAHSSNGTSHVACDNHVKLTPLGEYFLFLGV